MKLHRSSPHPRLLGILGGLLALAVIALALSLFGHTMADSINYIVVLLAVILLVAAVMDRILSRNPPPLEIERQLPSSLALGRRCQPGLTITHGFSRPRDIEFAEHVPVHCDSIHADQTVRLMPGHHSRMLYDIKPLARGPLAFDLVDIRERSWLGLWHLQYRASVPQEARVYPDFAALAGISLMATENRESALGIRRRQRRGEGTEFRQLREYRNSDSMRQVDWKATSRRLELVSREYQEERDQSVILLLDSGHRMLSRDDELGHFDHALNASLMLAHIALREGDAVGMQSFGKAARWVPPAKGSTRANRLLNSFYDLYAGDEASDYLHAASRLLTHQRKRALVVLVTNPRLEDEADLLTAVRLLRKRFMVLVVCLRETVLDGVMATSASDLAGALRQSATSLYLEQRDMLKDRLQAEGVILLDCPPQSLSVRMINQYLAIKQAGAM